MSGPQGGSASGTAPSTTKEALLADAGFVPPFLPNEPIFKGLSRDLGDHLVHGQRRWDVGLGIAGGIEELEVVQALQRFCSIAVL
jgi:hypothetical protein